jgi:hypothetical protein
MIKLVKSNRIYKIRTSNQISSVINKYFENTYGSEAYCGWEVAQDSILKPSDIFVSCSLSGRPYPFDGAYWEIFNNGKKVEIEKALKRIPKQEHITTANLSLNALGGKIQNLLRIMTEIPGIQLPIATKILHKKRPNLIPILDSQVLKHYGWKYNRLYIMKEGKDREDTTLGLIDLIKQDVKANENILREGAKKIAKKLQLSRNIKKALTPLRILDIIIWCGMVDSRLYYKGLRK